MREKGIKFLLDSWQLVPSSQGLLIEFLFVSLLLVFAWALFCVHVNSLSGPFQVPLLSWGPCGCCSPFCSWFQKLTPYRLLHGNPSPSQALLLGRVQKLQPSSICPGTRQAARMGLSAEETRVSRRSQLHKDLPVQEFRQSEGQVKRLGVRLRVGKGECAWSRGREEARGGR